MPKIVDHQARRIEIAAIVARLIAAGGMEAATIREVAQHSGYSKGVIEHYFDNKQELISGALAWTNHCYEERATELTRGLSGMASLRKRLEATLPLNEATVNEWKVRLVFWSMAAIDPKLRTQQARRFTNAVTFFERDILTAIEAGEINKPIDSQSLARHLVNFSSGVCCAALHNPSTYTADQLYREIDFLISHVSNGHNPELYHAPS